MTLRRHCLLLDLRNDESLIEQYEAWHRKVPTPVLAHLRRHGVIGLQIYRLGTRLCMVMDVEATRFDAQAMSDAERNDPELVAWERLMDQFQAPTPWTEPGRKWTAATCIYDLDGPVDAA